MVLFASHRQTLSVEKKIVLASTVLLVEMVVILVVQRREYVESELETF